ncbi:TetR/AcrR family transcriptional regulator [Nocardiopsis xinjiangensis]|uniref:TetR/AcrR family transcriptional regulator n=1 Tax=Nocardiopsis xinjiangensis TaxID=124285 RepID=UPI00034655A9|nr:TetR/AcrR family transcriptional regulator [Nocardiopsis xinjiangensis]
MLAGGAPIDKNKDLTTRARIRDAAVECFGRHGFGVTIRRIAEHAGVSPGLVIHHFGSKQKLHAACDDHVRDVVAEAKKQTLNSRDRATFLEQMAHADEYSGLLAYIIRSVQAGGELGRHFFDQMVADAEQYLALGVEAGTIRPSRAPSARARWLAASSLGSFLLMHVIGRTEPGGEFPRNWQEEYALPALEVYTEGLLTDRTMLDSYLLYMSDPEP